MKALGGSPIVYALSARAQAQSIPVVGFLNSASFTTYSFNATAFREGLREAGYIEGRNVAIEYRWANNDYSQLPALASELVSRKVAVIAATGDIASARAAQSATTTIPIVFTVGSDPVPFRLVTSLSRPTGNATGVTLFSSTLMAKRLEFLREVAPNARLIALLMNPDNLNYEVDVKAAQEAARGLGRQTILVQAKSPSEIDAAFDTIAQKRAGAVLIASDPMFLGQRERLAALAAKYALPVVSWTREFVVAGVLLSYGTSIQWMYREAGVYAGRILKGAKPSDLPIMQPTKFELIINMKTAKALGLTIPQSLLLRADEGDSVMDRRAFIASMASMLAVPLANAQQVAKPRRIGFLRIGALPIPPPFWDAMKGLGWVEGVNVNIEPRYTDREDQLAVLAAELVQVKVDLILTTGTLATKAAKRATNIIPIVFSVGDDPVGTGLVADLARPGGNLTGFAYGLYEEKLLEVLKAALPGVVRVAYPTFPDSHPAILRAAKVLGVQAQGIAAQTPEDVAHFYAAARSAGADAVLIPDIAWTFTTSLEQFANEAARSRLPTIGWDRKFAEAGGLLSYGPARFQHWPRLAAQVDKIFKGAKPADLAVEQPTKFELVINLKTAKALGLTIPQSLLLRADEVIQ